jgi:hypothetical protein
MRTTSQNTSKLLKFSSPQLRAELIQSAQQTAERPYSAAHNTVKGIAQRGQFSHDFVRQIFKHQPSASLVQSRKVFGGSVFVSKLESRRLKSSENQWAESSEELNACAANSVRLSVPPPEGCHHV